MRIQEAYRYIVYIALLYLSVIQDNNFAKKKKEKRRNKYEGRNGLHDVESREDSS